MEDCIFCKIVNKEIPSNFVYENDVNPAEIIDRTQYLDYMLNIE